MSQYYDRMAMNAVPPQFPQMQPAALDFSQGGLRSFEMSSPLLNEGAGGYAVPGTGVTPTGTDWMSSFKGLFDGFSNKTSMDPTTGAQTTQAGWGAPALQAGTALLNAFMGMKQYGLAKDTLNEGKRQFGLNYAAQKATTNSALEDRQRARVASNGGAYQSVGDYMTQNGIK